MKKIPTLLFTLLTAVTSITAVSCDVFYDDVADDCPDGSGKTSVSLEELAHLICEIPLGNDQMVEVHDAVCSSAGNGYDEEYMMRNLFACPGSGVGDSLAETKASGYRNPMKDLLRQALENRTATDDNTATRAADVVSLTVDEYLDMLEKSDMQIYWPYSDRWNGQDMPVITFNPEDGSQSNKGYVLGSDNRLEEIIVNEETAMERPVWVINRNDDSGYASLELRRKQDPDWGKEPGGEIIVGTRAALKSGAPDNAVLKDGGTEGTVLKAVTGKGPAGEEPFKTLLLKDIKLKSQLDCWFAGASELFIKTGTIESFKASSEEDLKLYSPSVTDLMVVIKRDQVGKVIPLNAVLVSEWTEQLAQSAFMIIEDDGGTQTSWKCSAIVKYNSKQYGIDLEIPYRASDDIVWRGSLTYKYLTATSDVTGHFGEADLTFSVVEH